MKKIIIFMSLLCCGLVSMAMPAKPGWHTITQSDGTTLKVQTVGNAFNSAILTTDGLTVERGDDGDFYYTSSLTGLTTVRAHDAGARTATEEAFISAQRTHLTMTSSNMVSRREKGKFGVGGSNADSAVPSVGKRRIPIILVEFKDKKFNNTREAIIESMLTGDESVGQYFRDQSNGMYEPEFDVFGIYPLSQNRQYYGAHSGNNNDKNLGAMVTEAVQKAAADGVSFKPYDTNSDGYCDVVIVIYAGVGEAQASTSHPEAIWPCQWDLTSAAYYSQGGNGAFRPSTGDPIVNGFAVFNELHGDNDNGTTIDGIGTFTHEFGHCLGLPDMYDTAGSHYGMGYWDIMCMGCYNNDGFTPPGYSAYEKVFMGWAEYVTPRPGTYYTLPVWNQKSAATDKALCIRSDVNGNEFFILENRKRQGWDRYMPGEGIMITHVTYSANRWSGNTVNNEDIQLLTLMNADNNWSYYNENADLWPQGSNNAFTDNSTPAAKLNMAANGNITGSAGYLGKPVTDMVINQDGTASFWYMKGAATSPIISVSSDNIDMGGVKMNNAESRSFSVFGQALTGDVALSLNDPNGVFTVDPVVISNADAANGIAVNVTFAPVGITSYQATITLSSNGAEDVIVNLSGQGLIEGYTPVMQPANEDFVNLTRFRANWTDASPVANVSSYTLEVNTKPGFVLIDDTNFSDVPSAVDGNYLVDIAPNYTDYLPEGWTCTSTMYSWGGYLIPAFGGILKSPSYSFEGYDKMTVVVNASSYYENEAVLSISSSQGGQEVTLGSDWQDYTIVLDCSATDAVNLTSISNYAAIKQVTIYAGDKTVATFNVNETGDDTHRTITGITGKGYIVKDLLAGGTFVYRVKAQYKDGTESPWSNLEEVTLSESEHDYVLGDVNHDGKLNVQDVTMLISYVLGGSDNTCCPICVNVDDDSEYSINVSDVTTLITKVLMSE